LSFTKAAEKLRLAQPSLTRQTRDLDLPVVQAESPSRFHHPRVENRITDPHSYTHTREVWLLSIDSNHVFAPTAFFL
jgi:hypothetical protein